MTTQKELLTNLCNENPDAIIVGSLGTISYDLKGIDHPNKVLIKGAMGAAVGCGFGIALSSEKDVIVVVGDGSFLMKLGSIATVLRYDLPNLRIVVLNNGQFASCGGQETYFSFLPDLPFEIYDEV